MLCLKVGTDAEWACAAVGRIDAVLIDHAHCEMKAASNAFSLATRYREDADLVRVLTDLAGEEREHFDRVRALLEARGGTLGAPTVDAYAAGLRRASRALPHGPVSTPLVDRLLVAAIIEARSCERFKLLADAATSEVGQREVAALWEELFAAEAGHYRTFVDLALRVGHGDRRRVVTRLERLAEAEAAIVTALARRDAPSERATIHG